MKKKVSELANRAPRKMEVGSPPRKSPGIPYISPASPGIEQRDRIAVVEYDDSVVMWMVRR